MACNYAIPAYRSPQGEISLHHLKKPDSTTLQLPCGNCLACRKNKAQAWTLRCQLELQQHKHAVFSTITYDDAYCPLTLSKRDLSLYLKRIRKNLKTPIRFFASGEYGERTQRPHYHAIIYGVSEREASRLEETWGRGHVRTYPATPAAIGYVAGYCGKKLKYKRYPHLRVDPTTGEQYTWEPPFIQMSRNPGIGAHAKKFVNSWRLYAVKDGHKMPVPRYLHEAWKALATPQQIEDLAYEIQLLALTTDRTKPRREAAEQILAAQQQLNSEKRKYG